MTAIALPPTRLEATLTCQAAGLQLHFAWAGIEISDAHLGVVVVPRADGRLTLRVIGYPVLTGLDDTVNLLDAEGRHEFPANAVGLNGHDLVCLAPQERVPALRQGFTLALAPAMASFLAELLPRLARVAALAAPVAQRVATLLAPAPSDHGLDICAELVATLLLDRKSVDSALIVVGQDHWAGRDPAWQAAFADPQIRQLLDAIAHEGRGGTTVDLTTPLQSEVAP
jgi:hypothetical protein